MYIYSCNVTNASNVTEICHIVVRKMPLKTQFLKMIANTNTPKYHSPLQANFNLFCRYVI